MSIANNLRALNRKEQFQPGFLSVFINANYFIKHGIYKGVARHADKLNGKLLDFGCGQKPYKHLFNVQEYIGMDIENEAHDHRDESIDVFYDGKKIPFANDCFDSVFSAEVFEHVFNLEEMIAEINRVMKKGGLLLVTLPFVWQEHEKPNDFARYSSFGIQHLLKKNNFEIEIHERSTTFTETVTQLRIAYIYSTFFSSNKFLRRFISPFFIFPLNLWGIFLSKILPGNPDLYLNHVIVARKK
ncbi:MAG: class I SAM-dependent methyltransferase [Bacteroidia bacterium]